MVGRWRVMFAIVALAACGEEYAVETDGGTTAEGGAQPVQASPDAAAPPLADAGAGGPTVHCGLGVTCARDQTCCVDSEVCSGANVCTCTSLAACDKRKHYECDDPSDCAPGLVCCATMTAYDGGAPGGRTLGRATCLAPGSCTAGYNLQLCDPTSQTSQCKRGRCDPSSAFPGVGYCE